jgi:hypothetical protein
MSRGFWFVAGTGAGVYVMVKARRAAEAFTPEGLSDRIAGLGLGARLFAEEVRAGRVEKETELRERLGLTLDGPAQLNSGFETLAGARFETGAGAPSSTQGSSTTEEATLAGARRSTTESPEER